jgi:hypothetical protein
MTSLAIRFFTILQRGKYDGIHRITLEIYSKTSQVPIDVVSFDVISKTISTVYISHPVTNNMVSNYLEIPIDGKIQFKTMSNTILTSPEIMRLLQNVVFTRYESSSITSIDALRLWFFMHSEPNISLSSVTISKNTNEIDKDTIISPLFIDNAIVQEQQTMSIINGTSVTGLGNRLARYIGDMGGNVIEISTADAPILNSTIAYYGTKTYTVDRLQKTLGFQVNKLEKPGISDMIITIGENNLPNIPF